MLVIHSQYPTSRDIIPRNVPDSSTAIFLDSAGSRPIINPNDATITAILLFITIITQEQTKTRFANQARFAVL